MKAVKTSNKRQEKRQENQVSEKDENERMIICFHSGELSFVCQLFNLASEYCKDKGGNAFVRNCPDGSYEIYINENQKT